jgi:hypothetical protein
MPSSSTPPVEEQIPKAASIVMIPIRSAVTLEPLHNKSPSPQAPKTPITAKTFDVRIFRVCNKALNSMASSSLSPLPHRKKMNFVPDYIPLPILTLSKPHIM